MAILEKIRVKFGIAASIIIALGLLSFIIDPQEVASAFQSMSSKYDVGKIGKKAVSYNDFQAEVDRMTSINELLSGGRQSAEAQDQARESAWQDLIFRNLFVKNARAAGINVGTDEMVDLTTGTNISPLISQNPAFADANGQYSKDTFLSFIQNKNSDETGALQQYWDYLQNSIRNNQYFEKYASLFSSSAQANPVLIKRLVAESNATSDVNFVMVPYGYATDSTIVVSDQEIQTFYNNHKKFFKQQASRDMEYVVFEVKPSAADIAATQKEISELRDEFAATQNVKSFLLKNSDRPYTEYWYKPGDLRTVASGIEDFVWSGEGVSDVINSGNNFYIARIVNSKMIPDSVYVSHILLQGTNAKAKADSIITALAGGADFSTLATELSLDKNSAADGKRGNLGWLTQSYMIPGFESVLTAETGKPYIHETQYGTHVILVSKKTQPIAKKQVAILEKEALASKETFNQFYNKANQFATAAAGSYENYRKAVDTLGVYSHPMNKLPESSNKLGSIDNTKEVTRWVYDNKPGKVSPIITVDNNYFFVTVVKAIHKEGIADLKDVTPTIRQQLYVEKMQEKKAGEIKEKIAGLTSLEEIAEKLGTSVTSQSGVSFAGTNNQSLDPKFIGAVSVSPEGKVCGPVAGNMGVYVYQVTAKNNGSFFTEDDAKNRLAQQNAYMTQAIIPVMMDDADVKDNRARFY